MKPEQILDMQWDLLHRMTENEEFQEAFLKTIWMSTAPETKDKRVTSQQLQLLANLRAERDPRTRELVRIAKSLLKGAYAFRVTEDMSLLIQHASQGLDGLDRYRVDMPPTPVGFCRFDRPLPVRDIRGNEMLIHWVLWGSTLLADNTPTTVFYFWNDMNDPDLISKKIMAMTDARSMLNVLGRWGFMGIRFMYQEQRVGPAFLKMNEDQVGTAWTPDAEDKGLLGFGFGEGQEFTNIGRYLYAMFLLMDQTVTDVSEEPIRKTASKLARRRGIPDRVSVVRLRRLANVNRREDESLVDWQYRWVVRGHWRWQPYGPGRKEVRRIWIAPYVKGPDDKPLHVTDKVYSLER